jgi:mRNA interferase MazF
MVRQGDIIRLDFDPQSGHEQAGQRPALVVSNDTYNNFMVGKAIVCPITSTNKGFPFQVRLDKRTKTTGVVMCEQVKALDINSRGFKVIERIPDDLLETCVGLTISMLDPD